jgi:integrase
VPAKPAREKTVRGVQRRTGARGTAYRVRYSYRDEAGERRWKSETFATEEAAEAFRRGLRERGAARTAAASALTVGAFLDRWLVETADRLAPKTLGNYATVVDRHLKPALGHLRLRDLAPLDLVDYQRAALARGVAPTSLEVHRAVLSGALAQAVAWRLIDRSPLAGVRAPRTDRTRGDVAVWSPQEARDALAAVDGDDAVLLRLMLCGGLRIAEALALRWEDVSFERSELSVRRTVTRPKGQGAYARDGTKRGRGRAVALDAETVAELRAQFRRVAEWRSAAGERWRDEGLVLPRRRTGGVRGRDGAVALLARLHADHGLPRLTPHQLRHTHASLMLAAGVPVKVVSDRLGHAQISITLDIYTHLLPGAQADGVTAMMGLIAGSGDRGGDHASPNGRENRMDTGNL